MAILSNIRKRGIFLIIVIAMALFAFVLADVIRNGGLSSNQARNSIATINGTNISQRDFSNKLQVTQQNSNNDLTTIQAVDQTWNGLVNQTLINEQIEKLGIDVGQDQVRRALSLQFGRNEAFSTNGKFDLNKFRGYLSQLKAANPQAYQQWLVTENGITEQLKSNTYFDLIQSGIGASLADAKANYNLENTKFDIQYVQIPYSTVPDDEVKVSDNDIQAYIDSHKNEFKTKGSRDIRYILFPEIASPADEEAIKEELAKLLKDQKVYNKAADMEEMEKGFANTTDNTEFLAENSDLPFEDHFFFKKELPSDVADSLFRLSKGELYGPYKEGDYWNYSKLVETRQMPDSSKIKHLLIAYDGLGIKPNEPRTRAEAEKLADSLLKIVQHNPRQFGDLAAKFSDDPSTKDKGGEIGWVPYPSTNSNGSPIIDFAFGNEPGSATVKETQFGYDIIFIEAISKKKKAIKLATLARKIEPSNKTQNDLFNKVTKFQIAAKDGDFSAIAKDSSYQVRPVKNLQVLDERIPGLGNHRNIVQWAFNKDTKVGDITRFEIGKGYVVLQLTGSASEGIEDVETASSRVKPILLNKKKGALLKEKIGDNQDLEAIAKAHKTTVKSKDGVNINTLFMAGKEPKVSGTLFGLQEGQISRPIIADRALYVVKLIKTHEPEDLGSYNGLVSQEDQKIRISSPQELLKALKDKANIEDRRATFY